MKGKTAAALRPAILLLLSLGFYALVGSPFLVLVLLVAAAAAYAVGRRIPAAGGRGLVAVGVGGILAVLAALKYAGPLLGGVGWAEPLARVLLPVTTVGLSYYCLQAISYLVDVRRGRLEAERDPVVFTLSLAFFPKVLQGPIERSATLLPQLRGPWRFDYDSVRYGLILIALGLLKKLVLADRLDPLVDEVFAAPDACRGLPLLVGLYGYAFQIYFDFSGYTDIAIGTARLFGVSLTGNFDRPYWATSVSVFWRRWHITLSTWLRDYLFLPVAYAAGRRFERRGLAPRTIDRMSYAVAALLTMAACGIWHGPRLTFLAWGVAHGLYLTAGALTAPLRKRLWRLAPRGWKGLREAVAIIVTFHLVALAWALFRSEGMGKAWEVYRSLAGGVGSLALWRPFLGRSVLAAFVLIVAWMAAERFLTQDELIRRLVGCRPAVRWAVYYAVVFAILFLGASGPQEFIYFRF